jgi:hypothetical protein
MSGDDEKDLLIEANRSIVDRQRHDNNIILTGGKWESTHDSARDFICHRIVTETLLSPFLFFCDESQHSFIRQIHGAIKHHIRAIIDY